MIGVVLVALLTPAHWVGAPSRVSQRSALIHCKLESSSQDVSSSQPPKDEVLRSSGYPLKPRHMQGPPRGKPMFVAARALEAASSSTPEPAAAFSADDAERALLLTLGSSQMLSREEHALPQHFFYVDELHCVGCSECAAAAPGSFAMFTETDGARVARCYRQGGDEAQALETARAVCPVDCIYEVSHEELARLEDGRAERFATLRSKFGKRRFVGVDPPAKASWFTPIGGPSSPAQHVLAPPALVHPYGFTQQLATEGEQMQTEMESEMEPVVDPSNVDSTAIESAHGTPAVDWRLSLRELRATWVFWFLYAAFLFYAAEVMKA